MTSSIPVSAALLRNLAGRKWHDDALACAFATGEALTRKAGTPPKSPIKRVFSKFISNAQRLHPRSPDRIKSAERRRMLGGSSSMPDMMRRLYTEGERAALWVVAQEVKRHGRCEKTINAIAAAAGVSRTTVQNAIRKAKHEDNKHISVEFRPGVAGQLSMTNIIRIVSSVWLRWLKAIKGGFKDICPSRTKTEKLSQDEPAVTLQGADERERAGTAAPSNRRGMGASVVNSEDGRQRQPDKRSADRDWRRFGRSSIGRGVV